MVGAADVTNGVKGEEKPRRQRGDGRETKVIVSVIETSKGSRLVGGGGGREAGWQMEKEAHVPREWLMEEAGKAFREKSKGGNQRQGNVEPRREEAGFCARTRDLRRWQRPQAGLFGVLHLGDFLLSWRQKGTDTFDKATSSECSISRLAGGLNMSHSSLPLFTGG